MDCSPPVSSAHGISQARILEWVANFSPRGSSPGIEPVSRALQGDSLPLSHQETPRMYFLNPINNTVFCMYNVPHYEDPKDAIFYNHNGPLHLDKSHWTGTQLAFSILMGSVYYPKIHHLAI